MDGKPIKWSGNEYQYTPKTSNWFWYVASGSLILIIISILMRNFLFAVFILIASFTIVLFGTKKPQRINFVIQANGIKIGPKLYTFEELTSFWVNYDPPFKKEVILEQKKKLSRYIKIPIENVDPNLIRETLLKFLKEKKHEESLVETIAERLGF